MWGSTDPEESRKAILKMVPFSRTSMPEERKQRTEPGPGSRPALPRRVRPLTCRQRSDWLQLPLLPCRGHRECQAQNGAHRSAHI